MLSPRGQQCTTCQIRASQSISIDVVVAVKCQGFELGSTPARSCSRPSAVGATRSTMRKRSTSCVTGTPAGRGCPRNHPNNRGRPLLGFLTIAVVGVGIYSPRRLGGPRPSRRSSPNGPPRRSGLGRPPKRPAGHLVRFGGGRLPKPDSGRVRRLTSGQQKGLASVAVRASNGCYRPQRYHATMNAPAPNAATKTATVVSVKSQSIAQCYQRHGWRDTSPGYCSSWNISRFNLPVRNAAAG
jgi:hypothetical protein